MPKPRGRGTSAEPRRTVKASSGRARAAPPEEPRARGGATAGSPAALRDGAERPASSRARPKGAKAAKAKAARAAAERPASPKARAGRARAAEPARAAPRKRRVRPASAEEDAALSPPRAPELDWDDTQSGSPAEVLAQRWTERGEQLFQELAAHGASLHEYRADLKEGRFVWLAPGGRVSAEARARLLCSWSRATSVLVMAWADPFFRDTGVERIDGLLAEQDDVDEEGAWQIAMEAADACGAAYLYRVASPQAWYFLALDALTFSPERSSFHPGAPVGLVLRGIRDAREAIASRAEPADVIRDRLSALSESLLHQARYAYRDTDWVARLDRTGACLMHLAKRIPRESFSAIAAGQRVGEWLERELAVELLDALSLIEDEWSLFG
ncbi:DUF6882 domain-containing protein [Sorangium sp. So ce1036]|uniref:DUF6882 domain-containing protein n=1 Tax=Sorangium sp. So ce1036 TaxID=3133328 RepID=UPI003F051A17